MSQAISTGSNGLHVPTPQATRYVPAKWVTNPSKLVEMMEENVGEKKFRVEVGQYYGLSVTH